MVRLLQGYSANRRGIIMSIRHYIRQLFLLKLSSSSTTSFSLRALEDQLLDQLNGLKTKLIRTKLDFLYNFLDEEAALDAFASLKAELEQLTAQLLTVQKKHLQVTHNKTQRETAQEKSLAMEQELSKLYAEVARQDVAAINQINRRVTELAKEKRQALYNYCAIVDEATGQTLYEEQIGVNDAATETNSPSTPLAARASLTTTTTTKRLIEEPFTQKQLYVSPLPKILL
jgi:hypothetical protein